MSEHPQGWRVALLRDLVTLKRGVDLPVQNRQEGEVPIFGSNGIVGFHSTATQDHPGIVTGRSGSIGNVYLNKKPFWALNTTLYSDQTHGNEIEYIYHFLKWFDLSRFSGGTGVPTLNRNDVHDQPIAIPPLPEQKKIAEILSGIDERIKRTRCQIAHFKKLCNATTKNLLGSLQDEMMPLSEVSINHDSRRVPIKSEERATRKGPYRYYGASGVIDAIDDFLFDGDYILIGEDGANIIDRNKPLAFRVSGRFWVNNHAHIIQPREFCNINFLTHYLESLDYTGIASGSAQPKITRAALDSILIPVPTLETQKKIGSAVESMISAASNAEQKENKLLDLKQAIASDLLSGRKRVSV
jgi:type I restriction enzyme S subunit